MKGIVYILFLLMGVGFYSCDKSALQEETQTQQNLPMTAAIKTGDWMINVYMENGVNLSADFGLTMIKFNTNNTLVATKDGNPYNGTWSETNTAGNNMFTINISTADNKLKKANGTWKVAGITEYFIDIKDGNTTGNCSINLMKH